jgi:hypothetical protein
LDCYTPYHCASSFYLLLLGLAVISKFCSGAPPPPRCEVKKKKLLGALGSNKRRSPIYQLKFGKTAHWFLIAQLTDHAACIATWPKPLRCASQSGLTAYYRMGQPRTGAGLRTGQSSTGHALIAVTAPCRRRVIGERRFVSPTRWARFRRRGDKGGAGRRTCGGGGVPTAVVFRRGQEAGQPAMDPARFLQKRGA